MNVIRHLFTGKDNQTWDMGRISWAACYLAVVVHDAFKPGTVQEFAIALGAVAAAHGVALGLKSKTEPGPDGGNS